jgi:hypothetical protein
MMTDCVHGVSRLQSFEAMCIHPLQAYSPIPFCELRTPSAIELGGRLSTHTHTLESAFSRGGNLGHISPRSEVPAEAGRLSKPPPGRAWWPDRPLNTKVISSDIVYFKAGILGRSPAAPARID